MKEFVNEFNADINTRLNDRWTELWFSNKTDIAAYFAHGGSI
jgi:hypothetical protein